MIDLKSKSPQKFGTNMISNNGRKTYFLYLAFHQEDPIISNKTMQNKVYRKPNYSVGITPGQSFTEEQKVKLKLIQENTRKEFQDVKDSDYKKWQRKKGQSLFTSLQFIKTITQKPKLELSPVPKEVEKQLPNIFETKKMETKQSIGTIYRVTNRDKALKSLNYPFPAEQSEWRNNLTRYEPKDTITTKRRDSNKVWMDKRVNLARKSHDLQPCRRGYQTMASIAIGLKRGKSHEKLELEEQSNKKKIIESASFKELEGIIEADQASKTLTISSQKCLVDFRKSVDWLDNTKSQTSFLGKKDQSFMSQSSFQPLKAHLIPFEKQKSRYDIFQKSQFIDRSNSKIERPPSSKFYYNDVRKQYHTNLRTNRALNFEKQMNKRNLKTLSCDYPYEVYDEAEQGRIYIKQNQGKIIPTFDKVKGRDNLMYRISEGNNLDELKKEQNESLVRKTLVLARILKKRTSEQVQQRKALISKLIRPFHLTLEEKILQRYYD